MGYAMWFLFIIVFANLSHTKAFWISQGIIAMVCFILCLYDAGWFDIMKDAKKMREEREAREEEERQRHREEERNSRS